MSEHVGPVGPGARPEEVLANWDAALPEYRCATPLAEALRTALAERDACFADAKQHLKEFAAEVEQLKAKHSEEAAKWDEQHAHQHAVNVRLEKERDAARAEAARMREALREIEGQGPDWVSSLARQALRDASAGGEGG